MIDPLKKSLKFAELSTDWARVDAVLTGSEALRGSHAYMPRHPREEDDSYTIRQSTHFTNYYKRTLETSVGQVLKEPLQVSGFTPDLTIFADSVNAQGQDLTEFSRHLFKDALHHGVSFIVVDAPALDQPITTLRDLQSVNFKPYWIQVDSNQVLAAYTDIINGQEKLTHFRYYEKMLVLTNGYEESYVERVRAYDLAQGAVTVTVWSKSGNQWAVTEEYTLSRLTQIPVIPVYSNRTGSFTGSPALAELAEINIAHWNSASEQKRCLGSSRVPFLMIKGIHSGTDANGRPKEVILSPYQVLSSPSADLDAKWVESSGAAIEQGFKDLERLEAEMEAFGAAFLTETSGTQTATASALEAAKSTSALSLYAQSLTDSLEAAMSVTGEFLGQYNASGSVSFAQINTVATDAAATPASTDQGNQTL